MSFMDHLDLFWPAIVSGGLLAILGGVCSVFVVLKRLAFVGQGVSHAAFGGVGLALALGATGSSLASEFALRGIVFAFAVAAALWMVELTRSQRGRSDSAIGIVLSASMALGFLLYGFAVRSKDPSVILPSIEGVLFGDVLSSSVMDLWITLIGVGAVLCAIWVSRRALIYWAFDEEVCDVYGIKALRTMRSMMIILAIGVVLAVQLAGIVLTTAIFVLPGASALRLSSRLNVVFLSSVLLSLLGTFLGFLMAFVLNWQIGPAIVLTQCVIYALCRLISGIR